MRAAPSTMTSCTTSSASLALSRTMKNFWPCAGLLRLPLNLTSLSCRTANLVCAKVSSKVSLSTADSRTMPLDVWNLTCPFVAVDLRLQLYIIKTTTKLSSMARPCSLTRDTLSSTTVRMSPFHSLSMADLQKSKQRSITLF